MRLYQKTIFTVLGLLFSCSFFAQNSQRGTLNGTLLDQDEVTIPFATVAVMKIQDSTVVTGSTTDIDGKFEFKAPKPGDYFLRFSAIGYSSTFSSRFEVEGPAFSRDFGAITMKEESTMLNEVMIETWRPKITMEGGNLNVRVEGTALAAGSSAFEVLSRAPGVAVDQDGNFQLNGKSGVSVMIDGRLTYLSQQELKTLLEGMSAENIESIEVITNPSAKYDAAGTSGILNIKLKKNTLSGLNGSMYGGYEYNQINAYNFGTNINYKKGNWNSFLNLDVRRRGRIRDQYLTRGFTSGGEQTAFLEQNAEDDKTFLTPTLRIGTDYSINDNHTIGIMADLTYQDMENDWNSFGTVNNLQINETTNIVALNNIQEDFNNNRINLHYDAKLDTVGTTLSANVDYVSLSRDSESSFNNTYSFNQNNNEENEQLFSNSLSDYEIFSARLDFSTALSENSQLELGLKASDVISESDLDFFIQENGGRAFDPSRSNQFRYEENIYAAYASFSSKLSDKFRLNAGLRLEQTEAKGISATMDQTTERDYLELFPSLSLEQTVSKNYKLNYAYNRRILRPDYDRLNPFIFYIDPYTYITGNPDLQPQFTNSFKLTQTFFGKYNLILGYDVTEDYIGEIPLQDPVTSETAFGIRNMDNYTSLSATLVAPVQILPEWNATNTIVFADNRYDINIDGVEAENNQLFFMAQSTHRVNLPMDLSLEMNALYQGPVAYGLYRIEDRFGLDLGIKKSFMNERLDVTLSADDIFKTMDVTGDSEFNGNTTYINQYMGNRGISLNLRYNLSSNKENTQVRRNDDLEELNRAGGQ
ncbi:TonB-dependent receptor domain-containing protein [Christiangramia crocea]|uniref:TonB-dependent receptor family protein n=1 Tax=Christiangramia crocea TaxID=2904124 RepID=A0A9X2A4T6_9FLAO|nr:TonB-dependent receptor [Gramella crocea]MCG9970874.1 TonB-dependent receptor family protein [Gramella crocea]